MTSLCAPPTIFRFLIHEDLTKYDLSSLRYCTIAGEALNPAVFETFKKLTGIKLMEGFGQTETTLTVATMPWMEPKPGSMGLPNPQYDVDLIDSEGRSVEAGEQGQIVIRTSKGKPLGLFKEYYRDAERTHEAWHDGIYYTGDVAWKDEDGYLWFVGRADDVDGCDACGVVPVCSGRCCLFAGRCVFIFLFESCQTGEGAYTVEQFHAAADFQSDWKRCAAPL